jgi:hypothetical protein
VGKIIFFTFFNAYKIILVSVEGAKKPFHKVNTAACKMPDLLKVDGNEKW